jgi:predicted extracellular nuclease
MRSSRILVTAALIAAVVPVSLLGSSAAADTPTELFFSEYIEGSSNNKALEIYNGTGAPVDLVAGGYNVQMFFNGSPTAGLTISLTGSVAAGDVFVLAQSSANATILAQADQTNGSGWFNGDDAVVLRKGTAIVDAIGQIGFDPGTEWGSGLTSTADNTLRRKADICAGDPNGTDVFDPAVQWDGFAQDTFDGLGSHTATCDGEEPPPPPPAEVCGDPFTAIPAIQGNSLASPLVGQKVSTEGVVVGRFQNGPNDTIFIQDPVGDGDPETSDGIYVNANAAGIPTGAAVRVVGASVTEFFTRTQLNGVTELLVCDLDTEPIEPIELTLPVTDLTDFERYEAMLVTFPQPLAISEFFNFGRFGEIVLTTDRQFQPTAVFEPGSTDAADLAVQNMLSRITLDDARSAQNPDPAIHPNGLEFTLDNLFRGGDEVANVTGALDYSFNLWRIQPTTGADYTPTNPRPEVPDVGGDIQVASFNVLNYFTTFAPAGRGADNEAELLRQEAKIVAAIAELDADVLGLIEIENNDAAIQRLVGAINAAVGAGTYEYLDTGVIGTDAIKVAFIYQPAAVELVGDYAVLDGSVDARFDDDRNRPALAQTFRAIGDDGAFGVPFTATVNHLKSKGSACLPGDPDTGDGSGNCNLTRTAAAEAIVDWLAGDPTGSGSDTHLVIGDLNAYDKETPIDALLAGGYTDLLAEFQGEFAYTYVFNGQLGYLDHALANETLLGAVTGTDAWLINADETSLIDYDLTFKKPAQQDLFAPDPFRSSDHDPVLVGLDVCAVDTAPTLDVSVTPETLRPPNHKYRLVEATVTAADAEDGDVTVELVSVTSNEPDDATGNGDGNTVDDIVILDDTTFELRAERAGRGNGRVYTITYAVTDSCGVTTTATAEVTVPK